MCRYQCPEGRGDNGEVILPRVPNATDAGVRGLGAGAFRRRKAKYALAFIHPYRLQSFCLPDASDFNRPAATGSHGRLQLLSRHFIPNRGVL